MRGAPSNYRSLLQKSHIKETIFCKRGKCRIYTIFVYVRYNTYTRRIYDYTYVACMFVYTIFVYVRYDTYVCACIYIRILIYTHNVWMYNIIHIYTYAYIYIYVYIHLHIYDICVCTILKIYETPRGGYQNSLRSVVLSFSFLKSPYV